MQVAGLLGKGICQAGSFPQLPAEHRLLEAASQMRPQRSTGTISCLYNDPLPTHCPQQLGTRVAGEGYSGKIPEAGRSLTRDLVTGMETIQVYVAAGVQGAALQVPPAGLSARAGHHTLPPIPWAVAPRGCANSRRFPHLPQGRACCVFPDLGQLCNQCQVTCGDP